MWSHWYLEAIDFYSLEQLAFILSHKLVLTRGSRHKQTLVTKLKISLLELSFKVFTKHLLNEKRCPRYKGYNICLSLESLERIGAWKKKILTWATKTGKS